MPPANWPIQSCTICAGEISRTTVSANDSAGLATAPSTPIAMARAAPNARATERLLTGPDDNTMRPGPASISKTVATSSVAMLRSGDSGGAAISAAVVTGGVEVSDMFITVALSSGRPGDTTSRRCGGRDPAYGFDRSYTVEVLGLVTADAARDLDSDLLPFDRACRAILGDDRVRVVSWDDPSVDWAGFDNVIIRSTWDYPERLHEFLQWVDTVSMASRLVNGAAAIRWSADKRYLQTLATEGVATTPTTYVPPGSPAPAVNGLSVVKPTVGAGSSGARRCVAGEVADHVAALHADGFTAMVQPYLDLLDERGETALCFVASADGTGLEFSHAFGKAAILTSTDVEQEGGFIAKEEISARLATPAELELAAAVLSSEAMSGFDLAFARVDIVPFRRADGTETSVVMEVELIEPSFYLATSPRAAELLATRVIDRMTPSKASR